jgi:hypothetical protein
MRTPNEFWIALHELSHAMRQEGKSTAERKMNILQTLSEMPPVARREVECELAELMIFLPEVYVAMRASLAVENPVRSVVSSPIFLRDGSSPKTA